MPEGASRGPVDDPQALRLMQETVDELNAKRPEELAIRVAEAKDDEFVLVYPHEDLPEGQCMDERFTEIQWILHDKDVDAGIHGGEFDEDEQLYRIRYKIIHWD